MDDIFVSLIILTVLILFYVVFCIILFQLAKRRKESKRRKEAELRLGSHSFFCPYCDKETPFGYCCGHCGKEIDTTRIIEREKYNTILGYRTSEIYWRKPGERTEDEIQREIQQKRAEAAATAVAVTAWWAWDKKRQEQKRRK